MRKRSLSLDKLTFEEVSQISIQHEGIEGSSTLFVQHFNQIQLHEHDIHKVDHIPSQHKAVSAYSNRNAEWISNCIFVVGHTNGANVLHAPSFMENVVRKIS